MSTIDKTIQKVAAAVRQLPRVLANEAVNHSLDAFKQQAWDGKQWRRRIYRKGEGASILVKSGRGRRSIKVISVHQTGFVYGSDVEYMAAHNDGFTGIVQVKGYVRQKYKKEKRGTGKLTKKGKERMKTVKVSAGSIRVKAHSRRMNLPQRQFAGQGKELVNRLSTKGAQYILKQFS